MERNNLTTTSIGNYQFSTLIRVRIQTRLFTLILLQNLDTAGWIYINRRCCRGWHRIFALAEGFFVISSTKLIKKYPNCFYSNRSNMDLGPRWKFRIRIREIIQSHRGYSLKEKCYSKSWKSILLILSNWLDKFLYGLPLGLGVGWDVRLRRVMPDSPWLIMKRPHVRQLWSWQKHKCRTWACLYFSDVAWKRPDLFSMDDSEYLPSEEDLPTHRDRERWVGLQPADLATEHNGPENRMWRILTVFDYAWLTGSVSPECHQNLVRERLRTGTQITLGLRWVSDSKWFHIFLCPHHISS